MLGKDLYKIEGIETVYGAELKALVLLYAALLNKETIALYLQLIYQEKSDFKELGYLLNCLNLSLPVFESELQDLAGMQLVNIYQNKERYIFVLEKPLAYREFLDHELFGRLLLSRISREYYCFLSRPTLYDVADKSAYKRLTFGNNFAELHRWDALKEDAYQSIKSQSTKVTLPHDSLFPINDFMNSVSANIFPLALRTKENLQAIASLADIYGIGEAKMRINLMNATKVNPPTFDLRKMRNLCRNSPLEPNLTADNSYRVPCALFITKLQNGKECTDSDKNVIDKLVNRYHLLPEVVNVLFEHVLKECDNRLIASYAYNLAADLYRNDIDDWQKALDFFNEHERKIKAAALKGKGRKEVLPVYDNKNNPTIGEEVLAKYRSKAKKEAEEA